MRPTSSSLTFEFGSFGTSLYRLSRGIDEHPVNATHIRKPLSVEDTFAQDLPMLEIPALYAELLKRLERAREHQRLLPKALFLKLRFHDFVTTTVQTPATAGLELAVFYRLRAQRGNAGSVRCGCWGWGSSLKTRRCRSSCIKYNLT